MTERLRLALGADAALGVTWHAPLLDYSGYADEARAFVGGLRRAGRPVKAVPLGRPVPSLVETLPQQVRRELEAAFAEPGAPHPVHVLHVPGHVLPHVPGALRHVARTMFETDGLPASWVRELQRMDEVWVPSAFNVATFRAAGVTRPIHVVPGGVDADTYRPGLEPLAVEGLNGTVFLSVFEWSFRKGWDVLLEAWARAFGAGDDVTLLLRTYPITVPGAGAPRNDVERAINTFLRSVGSSRRRAAPIVVLPDPVPLADMPRLYATADAYVGPSRGEGWGRPFLEAMACGLPVIATRWSGNLEFMDDDNSLLVDVDALEPVDGRAELVLYQRQRWARPSVAHLTELLRQLAGDRGRRGALGWRARQDVERRWTWEAAGAVVRARLDEMEAGLRRHVRPVAGRVRVRWVGDHYARHSLAHVNRELGLRLAGSARVALEVVSTEPNGPGTAADPRLGPLQGCTGDVLGAPAQIEVRHQWPPDWRPPDHGAWVVVQPWEFGGLPDEWLPALHHEVDEVWCYTNHVRHCYVASGVPEEIVRVVPLGVDARRFTPDGPPYPLRTSKGTRLLFLGGTIPRKGIDVLLRAYGDAFSADDDVCLVVKSTGSSSFYRPSAQDDAVRALADDPAAPEVELITDDLSPEEVAALYRSCHVLVHPYRGEGFGLPVAEAMASGLPVVVTAHGACLDFCDEENAYLVPADVVPIAGAGLPPSSAGHWWAEPDAGVLARLLRHVVEHPEEARAKGAAG
ncbi:MAG: glycosyltransferase, partial [Actinomycetota bacterium]|nr:glycosyltransferase [Actinomycetota bacterium]